MFLGRFDRSYIPRSKQEIDATVSIEGLITELGEAEEAPETYPALARLRLSNRTRQPPKREKRP